MAKYGPHVSDACGDMILLLQQQQQNSSADGILPTTPEMMLHVRELRDALKKAYDYVDDTRERIEAWKRYELMCEVCRVSPRRMTGVLMGHAPQ